MKILIIGVNGFIGSNLSRRILADTDWTVYGMDINYYNLDGLQGHKRFNFTEGDSCSEHKWIDDNIRNCDIVIPLVAIAQPKRYVTMPLRLFEINFEGNLRIVRSVHKHGKRLLFMSTSEVYGMCADETFDEEESNLVYGPTSKMRWIYASAKQLLDRVIYAYGRDHGLRYTLMRPFNWIGPRLDTPELAREGNSRVLTRFITNLMDGDPIPLVSGGNQERSFTDIDDGVDAIMTIIDKEKESDGRIFNIGNPKNVCTIKRLGEMTREIFSDVTRIPIENLPPLRDATESEYYGEGSGFQDIEHRTPSIRAAREALGWSPKIPIEVSVRKSIEDMVARYPLDESYS